MFKKMSVNTASMADTNQEIQGDSCRIAVQGMTCNSCVKSIEEQVGNMDGVNSVKVGFIVTVHKKDIGSITQVSGN